jgi:hypothetical protein
VAPRLSCGAFSAPTTPRSRASWTIDRGASMSAPTTQNPSRPAQPRRGRRRRPARPGPRLWHCPNCDAVVVIQLKETHLCPTATSDSAPSNETPLDRFFLSYPSFEYDRSLSPAESFARLQRHQRWRRGSSEGKTAWGEYQRALKEEFQLWYGAENDLGAWHALCRAIGINPLPATCEGCEKVRVTEHTRAKIITVKHSRPSDTGT